MTAGIDEITQWALTLPVDQRAQVANALLASLDDPADSAEVHEAWTAEITSRVDDITSGRVKTIPHEEVKRQLAERRAARQDARQD
ncbi:MAG: addiction module protein [Gordonia sp. (in: high G+C Gram-positive bacteria)]|uniref:addiction module protein n=1 Tax=Gordonia sp. (in: high G+C Gram-positive bacteria) TaxID=84139 RepID=UPI003BB4A8A3